ncbi:PAS domain S-box protein [Natronolimnobius sp. AArcel1]|uniref:GAF domain-containing sensor histidine kinase n=1 Tax=Natronolimnobius sp. AArcel1 TaxID=1679093 RepID=UPI0013EAF9E5|nr:ATP-binding protein [Natronolimnobius sp. AArcel1]NGM67453.1 PAS domain S-box protein [Natronolimnobius sp. AArcel1]
MGPSNHRSTDEPEQYLHQQQVLADLGSRALETESLENLFQDATETVLDILPVDRCAILEYRAGSDGHDNDSQVILRTVAGTDATDTPQTTSPIETETQAGYALEADGPVVVEDLRTDPQFRAADPFFDGEAIAGVAVSIGPTTEPWGVLCAHSTTSEPAVTAGVPVLQNVANILASTLQRECTARQHDEEAAFRRTVLETCPLGITLIDADGMNEFANERAEALLGRSNPELQTYAHDDDRWSLIDEHGEELAEADLPFATVRETGEPVYDETVGIEHPDGERVWLSAHCGPVIHGSEFEGAVYALRDITERRRLESKLEEILGRVDDAICALDTDLRYTHVNERAEELLQQSESELLGERLWERFPEATEDEAVQQSFEEALETLEQTSYEHYYEPVDAWFEVTLYPSETGISVYFRDITERKESQRQLEESNERLEQFAYAASHDLQEPLRMVTSYLQLIEGRYSDELDDDAQEFIDFAVDGAERMREMIDGLLAFSRVETQGAPFEPVDLNDVLADVRRDLRVQIDEQEATITADSLPTVYGDGNQLRQVIQNLLSNAITYAGDEPPEIEISSERHSRNWWRIDVSDAGIGIEPEDAARVFGVFQRLHADDEGSGSGIGLALCERIVERHGGDIWVDSEPGEGSTFSLTLPTLEGNAPAESIDSA